MIPSTAPDEVPNLSVETVKGGDIAWVVLQGEADISTLPELEACLEHVELDGTACVHLHVTRLDFADTASIRRLALFARRVKQTGLNIKTCGANATVRMIAGLLHAQDDLGLT